MKPAKLFGLCLGLVLCLTQLGCSGNSGDKDAGPDACDGCEADDDSGPIACASIGQCPVHNLCLAGFCQPGTACNGAQTECPNGYECNVMQEVCVPKWTCTGDADCEDVAAPRCLVADGVCVECTPATQQQDCGDPADVVCSDSYTCEPVGPDCTSDADCVDQAPKTHCDVGQGKCYACLNDGHCEGALVCKLDTRTCVQCYNENHCTNPYPHCWTDTNTCVECTADVQCTGDERCNLGTHTCTELVCTNDNDCVDQPGPHCNQANGDCVQCLTHDHCGAYQWCRDFSCQSGCQTDQECADKLGAGYRCDNDSTCFYAECLTDADCAGNQDGERCKLDEVPSNPQQYTCVECIADEQCDEYFMCAKGTGQYYCQPMPCYQYQDPAATCAQIDPCYECSYGTGACEPRTDCANDDCCQGYTCNAMSHCERSLNCQTNEDCAADSICDQQTLQCEYQSCCGDCQSGWFCNEQSCQCEQGECKQLMDTCNVSMQNCCEGLTCSFMGICFAY